MMSFIMSFFAENTDARILAASMRSEELEELLKKDECKVTQIYPWVADFQDSKIADRDIVEAMMATENVTWMSDDTSLQDDTHTWRETPELKETPRHLDHLKRGCVHELTHLGELLQRFSSHPSSPAMDGDDIFALRQAVFKHCGIGGVLHPAVQVGHNHGSVSFQGDCASVVYGRKVYAQPPNWWIDTSFDDSYDSRMPRLFEDRPTISCIPTAFDIYHRHNRRKGSLEMSNIILFRAVPSWLGEPTAWQQSTMHMDSASLFPGPLHLNWEADPFSFFRQPSEKENWNPDLLRYCVGILKELLLAMKELNTLGGCCKSFPIFIKLDSSNRVTAADVIFESVWQFVRLLSEPLTTTNNSESVLRDVRWRTDICRWTLDTFKHLFGREDEALFFLYRSTRIDGIAPYILHIAALYAQIFSVGLATFCQGHCSDFYMPQISRTIERFHLFGAVPTGPCVIAEKVELSCLGDMLNRPVWAFCLDGPLIRTDLNLANRLAMFQRKYDVQARLSQLFDLWGANIIVSEEEPSKSFKVCMGRGFLHEKTTSSLFASSSDPMLHWSTTDNDGALPASWLEHDKKAIIGAVSSNQACPLRRHQYENALAGSLVDLRTHPGGWKTCSRTGGVNVGVGGGPMAPATVGAAISLTQQRFDPTFMKGSQVQQWNKLPHELTVLNAPWGLEFSLCTGVARRVPLRALLNETVVAYLQSRLNARFNAESNSNANAPKAWWWSLFPFFQPKSATTDAALSNAQALDQNVIARIRRAGSNDDAAAIWTDLNRDNPVQFNALATVLESFMDAIQCARVDDEKNLLLWWPEPNGSTDRGIKLDISWYKGNSWIPVLEDTESCAIFGLATCDCLICSDHGKAQRTCQNGGSASWALSALKEKQPILSTGIAAEGGDTANMNLTHGSRLILNNYKAERHVVKVREITNGAPCVLEYRGAWSRPAIAWYNRSRKMTNVRESAEFLSTGIQALIVHRKP